MSLATEEIQHENHQQGPGHLWRRIPGLLLRQALFRIPAIGLTVLPAWLLHTYLVVFKNEGFSGMQHWTAPYCNVTGNGITAFVAFGTGSAVFWSVLISLLRCGPTSTFQTIMSAPAKCLSTLADNNPNSRLGMALGLGLVLLGSNYFGLPYPTRLAFGGAALFLGMGYPGSLVGIVLGEWIDLLKNKFQWLRTVDVALLASSTIAALPVAFLTSWLLSGWTSEKLGMLALIFVGFHLYRADKGEKAENLKVPLLALLAGWWLLDSLSLQSWADDGGWREATSGNSDLTWANIVRWWNSQGSGQAITQGVIPVAGAGLGAAMVPPIAPPKGGLDYKEEVTQHVTKDEQEFVYGLGIARQGTDRLPADGRSEAFGYSVGESNDPKLKPGAIARAAHFTTTAPPGFELRIIREDSAFGGDHKQYSIVAVASPESAFAPGEIPAVVYAEANTPVGLVRGHMAYNILVGTGKLHIEPMERDWLRADGEDHFQITAFIEPTDRAQISDQERHSTLSLAAFGPNANWAAVSAPGDGEFYRYWTVQAAKASDPKTMKEALELELGLEGRFAGGLFQQKIPIRILPPPRLEAAPSVPFLVPDHQERVEVEITLIGQAPSETWELDPPMLAKGEKDLMLLEEGPVRLSATKFKVTFSLGKLPDDQSCVETNWTLVAREKKGAQTEELNLRVLAVRPGVVILSKTPFQVLADGQKVHELKLTVLRWNEQFKKVDVDEAALHQVLFEVIQEGDASKALEAAELQFQFQQSLGSELSRHAIYHVSSLLPVPGIGLCQGKFDAYLKDETDEAFRRPFPIVLALDAVSLLEKNKEEEWKLILDVLERYFKRPYDKAEDSDKGGKLQCLIQIYDKWIKELEHDKPFLGSYDLREKRKLILKEAVATWTAIGQGYMGDSRFYENLLRAAVTVDWVVSNAFTVCAKAALAWTGPLGATIGATIADKARGYVSKFVGNTLNGVPAAETWKDIEDDIWGAARDFCWQDAPELLAKAVFGKKSSEGEVEVPTKVKVALLTGFLMYRFYRNYVDEDPVTKEKPVGFWRACWLTSQDLGMKFAGDMFENYVKECPVFKGGPKVKDLKSPFSRPAPAAGPGSDAAPSAPPSPSAPPTPAGPGGDAAPSAPPSPSTPPAAAGPGGDAAPSATPSPSAPPTPAGPGGDAAPSAPPSPSAPPTPAGPGGDGAPSAPPSPSGP